MRQEAAEYVPVPINSERRGQFPAVVPGKLWALFPYCDSVCGEDTELITLLLTPCLLSGEIISRAERRSGGGDWVKEGEGKFRDIKEMDSKRWKLPVRGT